MKKTIGLITYHSAYNYGSVLQAYATQVALRKLGYDSKIINYRMINQKKYYQSLCRTSLGLRLFVIDFLLFPIAKERKIRNEKFESFITKALSLSDEANTAADALEIMSSYDCVISGSDQIWNLHSNELDNQPFDAIRPYLLDGYDGGKISYASSIGNMTKDELDQIIDCIRKFDAVSFRENTSVKKISDLYGIFTTNVPDPTFLLSKKEWIESFGLQHEDEGDYIFYYSLGGPKIQKRRAKELADFAYRLNLKVKMVTPFAYFNIDKDLVEIHPEYGPEEFLDSILNAKMVITDSYHGTILSVNFNKDVYSLCGDGESEFRKTDILRQLCMSGRIITSVGELNRKEFSSVDYTAVNKKIESFRQVGLEYLSHSINSAFGNF